MQYLTTFSGPFALQVAAQVRPQPGFSWLHELRRKSAAGELSPSVPGSPPLPPPAP